MNKEELLQNELNMHLRRHVIFTYKNVKYAAELNLTKQYISSIKQLVPKTETNLKVEVISCQDPLIYRVNEIENYLKDEGFFDY